ncbi:Uncharacterized protein Fot_40284 [Forsythia ovata]|uniref:Uncharacterized protein n=1 Tax=Forsythia ovata TaxID=205694 RepID=A0ABD1S706_9LAMI
MVHDGRVRRAVERVWVTELLSAQYEEEINTLTCLLLDRSSCVTARSIIQDELKEDNTVLPSVELAKLKAILFGEKSELILQTSHPDAYEISQKFACVSFVFDHLSVTDCLNQNSGFIDGAAPEKAYFYLYVKNLAYKLGINLPRLKKMVYANVWAIRDEPALNEQIPVNLHNILDYVIQVLKDIVSSMLMGVSFVPNEGEYHALFAGLECPCSPGYEHTQEAGELE